MHSSYLSGLGGKKMQLEITTTVLTTGAAMLNQMAEAKAKKETLAKRSGGADLGGQREAEAGLQKEGGEFERGF
jgi:hypothetical protein